MRDLLSRFVTAIDAEIALIEKETRDQSFELLSGQRDEASAGGLYVFILADTLNLPEDASGHLKVGGAELPAMVVAQEGNRIWLLLESTDELPPYFPTARLVLNETELLKRLREKISLLRSNPNLGLAPKVFGREPMTTGNAAVPPSVEECLGQSPETLNVLRQCLGSDVTYLWGPPGTGKTFTIAALVAALSADSETVLVTSHTHVAVEQALWASIEPPGIIRPGGLLFGSPLVADGRILKIGKRRLQKIPRSVELECYLEDEARKRAENVGTLEEEVARLSATLTVLYGEAAPWREFAVCEALLRRASAEFDRSVQIHDDTRRSVDSAKAGFDAAETALKRAETSFFLGRSGRVERAKRVAGDAGRELSREQAAAGVAEAHTIRLRTRLAEADANLLRARSATQGLRALPETESEIALNEQRRDALREEIDALKNSSGEEASELVRNAIAIFATLTKLYTDRGPLRDMTWDTVVIDEVSMAMPPLLAYAATRARKRVIVVGDPYQLPPVVRSDPDSEGGLLGQDIFDLVGITRMIEHDGSLPALAKLQTQRRMHPEIVSLAKELIGPYSDLETAPGVGEIPPAGLSDALSSDSSLATVDISAFHPWSGKMPGSLSRFNFVSAQASVELASMYARSFDEPSEEDPPRIGIVTPYTAQRRYLNKLIEILGLGRWVMAGTVHTFQGNECDVIIFDSVLGEPHWTARLTNPFTFDEVKRDLNVAVTRARHQFVFVGDFRWLRKNAKPSSAFGKLCDYLDKHANHRDGAEVLGEGFRMRVAQSIREVKGWTLGPGTSTSLLTESDFYDSFSTDLQRAKERVILYTPFIGKTRWPVVEPLIAALRERSVDVYLLHKPLSDPEWRRGDHDFGSSVFAGLAAIGVRLIPVSGVHAKTIVIDGKIVYEGSLNWASQTASYEHMWRFESKDMATLVEKMLQLKPVVEAFEQRGVGDRCPACGGSLVLINQAQQSQRDVYPVKLGCSQHAEDGKACQGYLRRVDGRPPFLKPPVCSRGARMRVHLGKNGKPWDWRCGHKGCKPIRWARGDCLG